MVVEEEEEEEEDKLRAIIMLVGLVVEFRSRVSIEHII